jgi:hypothetical protein
VVARSQRNDLCAMLDGEGVRYHDEATAGLACLCGNEGFEARYVVNRCENRLRADGGGGFERAHITIDKRRRRRIEQ